MNYEQARFNMVEQQIRPWEVLDFGVLDVLMSVRREEFVPEAYKGVALSEADGPERADRGLTAGAGTLDEHVDALHAVLHGTAAGGLGGHLRGERGRLAGALEADGAG